MLLLHDLLLTGVAFRLKLSSGESIFAAPYHLSIAETVQLA
jgi:hypothetical protein